jgi:hypothetical protein
MNEDVPDLNVVTVLIDQLRTAMGRERHREELSLLTRRAVPHPLADSPAELALALELLDFCFRVIREIGPSFAHMPKAAYTSVYELLDAEESVTSESSLPLCCSQLRAAVGVYLSFSGRLLGCTNRLTAEAMVEALDQPRFDSESLAEQSRIDDSTQKVALLVLALTMGFRLLHNEPSEAAYWAARASQLSDAVDSLLRQESLRHLDTAAHIVVRLAWAMMAPRSGE